MVPSTEFSLSRPLSVLITIDDLAVGTLYAPPVLHIPDEGDAICFLLICVFHLSSYPECCDWPSHFHSVCLISPSVAGAIPPFSAQTSISPFHHRHLQLVTPPLFFPPTAPAFRPLFPPSFQMIQEQEECDKVPPQSDTHTLVLSLKAEKYCIDI